MRAVGIKGGRGSADDFFIEENVPDPTVEGDRILVRIRAFGLNRMDIIQREDKYPYPLLPESGTILGVEFSGVVEAMGTHCSDNFRLGQRVFGLAYGGAYAEKIAVSEKMLMPIPDGLSFVEAAGVPETYFTAIQAIHLVGRLEPGESVLIHAGASGVGQAAIQVARIAKAAKVFTTARTDAKCELCLALGADIAMNSRDPNQDDFATVIRRETQGKGVNLIIDLVGQAYWHRNVASAAMEGKIVTVAAMSGGVIEGFSLRDMLNKRLSLLTTTLRTRSPEYQTMLKSVFVEQIVPHLASGQIRLVTDRVYPWTEVGPAHKRMESNANAGKLICTVD